MSHRWFTEPPDNIRLGIAGEWIFQSEEVVQHAD